LVIDRPTATPLPAASDARVAIEEAEARALARVLAEEGAKFEAYARRATVDDEYDKLNQSDADRAREVLERPLSQLDWPALHTLARIDPIAAVSLWRALLDAARDELESGQLAAEAADPFDAPQARARFLAVREAFSVDLRPRGAVEQAIVDVMVHAHLEQLAWIKGYHVRNELKTELVDTGRGLSRRSPSMSDAAPRSEAMDFVERFNRVFLRGLRSLDEHRRRAPVFVQNAAQVNVGEQQVNLTSIEGGRQQYAPG
jgi:hypothetical protein